MLSVLGRVQALVRSGGLEVSQHGAKELEADNILLDDVIAGINAAETVEEYPSFRRGPAVLVLQHDPDQNPIHVLWGIPKDRESPAVLVTAYRPDPARWSADFRKREKR